MSLGMTVKKYLHAFGYDIKEYRSFYDTVVKPLNIKTIIDIGANTGAYSKEMREEFPEATIFAFEPLHDCFKQVEENMKGDKKFRVWNVALGNQNGTTEINKSSFHPSSSILSMVTLHKELYPKSKESVTETIQIKRLDDVLQGETLEKNILIKIDVQGFEDKVIIGGKNIISQAAIVVAETSFVPLYENQALFGDIHNLLNELGFSYYGDAHRHYNPKTKKLIYEDSVFIKKDLLSI
jgi:FkbM family methyltransferase